MAVTLSEQKKQILELIADGLNNAEIAERMYLHVDTIKSHIRILMKSTDTRNRTHLLVWAIRNGYIQIPVKTTGGRNASTNS